MEESYKSDDPRTHISTGNTDLSRVMYRPDDLIYPSPCTFRVLIHVFRDSDRFITFGVATSSERHSPRFAVELFGLYARFSESVVFLLSRISQRPGLLIKEGIFVINFPL